MPTDLIAVALGLGSALTWGAGDFCGGLSARKQRAETVALLAQFAALASLAALSLAWRPPLPAMHTALWAVVAGIGNGLGMLLLYAALGRGAMTVAAPVAALFTALVPVAGGALLEGVARPPQLAGFVLAAAAIWLVAQHHPGPAAGSAGSGDSTAPVAAAEAAHARTSLLLAIGAGLSFGAFLLCMKLANPGASELPTMVLSRAASVPVLLLAWWRVRRAAGAGEETAQEAVTGAGRLLALPRLLACAAGSLDAAGNTLFLSAIARGRLDVGSVLSALYPVTTVLLAALVLGERPARLQQAGLGAALAAVVLIAL